MKKKKNIQMKGSDKKHLKKTNIPCETCIINNKLQLRFLKIQQKIPLIFFICSDRQKQTFNFML